MAFAAKTVVSATFVAACGGEAATPSGGDDVTDDEVVAVNAACKDGLAKLKTAYPKGDKEWWRTDLAPPKPLAGDDKVTTCCESLQKKTSGDSLANLEKFRSVGCCHADYSHESVSQQQSATIACSPWGPPVPPSMDAVA